MGQGDRTAAKIDLVESILQRALRSPGQGLLENGRPGQCREHAEARSQNGPEQFLRPLSPGTGTTTSRTAPRRQARVRACGPAAKKLFRKVIILPGQTASLRCHAALRPNKFAITGVLLLCGAGLCTEPRLASTFRAATSRSAGPRPAPTVVND